MVVPAKVKERSSLDTRRRCAVKRKSIHASCPIVSSRALNKVEVTIGPLLIPAMRHDRGLDKPYMAHDHKAETMSNVTQ